MKLTDDWMKTMGQKWARRTTGRRAYYTGVDQFFFSWEQVVKKYSELVTLIWHILFCKWTCSLWDRLWKKDGGSASVASDAFDRRLLRAKGSGSQSLDKTTFVKSRHWSSVDQLPFSPLKNQFLKNGRETSTSHTLLALFFPEKIVCLFLPVMAQVGITTSPTSPFTLLFLLPVSRAPGGGNAEEMASSFLFFSKWFALRKIKKRVTQVFEWENRG